MSTKKEWRNMLLEKGKRKASHLLESGFSILLGIFLAVEHFDWTRLSINTKVGISIAGILIIMGGVVFLYYYLQSRKFKI